jgi:hypothetical protein
LLEGTWWISTMEIHQAATDHPKISPKCPVLSYRMCLLINIKIICRLLLFVVRFKHARSSHLAGMWNPIGFGFPGFPGFPCPPGWISHALGQRCAKIPI